MMLFLLLIISFSFISASSSQSLECLACQDAFKILDGFVSTYGNDMIQFVKPICDVIAPFLNAIIGTEECDPQELQTCIDLCNGMITSWGPVIADVFVALELDGAVDCGRMGLCPPVNTTPVYPKTKLVPSGKLPNPVTGTIFHVSDIHYDHYYTPDTNTNCEMPVCCHVTYGPGPSGKFGDFACDSPDVLVKDALDQMKLYNPNFLIYTGDTPAHDLWLQTHDSNVGAIANVSKWSLEALPANTKYFPALGNHAAAPVDNFGGPAHDYWLYGPVGDMWSPFLPSSSIVSFKWGGYYTAVMEPGLRAIVLQTNYYDVSNLWLKPLTQPDIAGQFAWFENILQQIEALGEKAVIIGHEKPASFSTAGPWQAWFLELVTKYKDTITAHFFGHNHNDFFQVLHDPSSGTPIGVVYLQSSITPAINNTNPSYRLYQYSQESKSVLDYQQYRADLALSNKQGYISWFKAYEARADWGLTELTPETWQEVGLEIGSNKTAWDFFKFQYHGGLTNYPLENLDTNEQAAMCCVLGDTTVNYDTCMKNK